MASARNGRRRRARIRSAISTAFVTACERLRELLGGPQRLSARFAIGRLVVEAKSEPGTFGAGAVARMAAFLGRGPAQLYRYALLDTAASGMVAGADVGAMSPSAQGLSQSQPALAVVGTQTSLAFWTEAAIGDANGEELWLKPVGWGPAGLHLSTPEVPLPRWPQARKGDQRLPALAASPLPALIMAWTDLGRALVPGEANDDVVLELGPAPLLRTLADGAP